MRTAIIMDIDNTLTPPRQPIREEMVRLLSCLSVPFHVAAGSHMELLKSQFFDPLYHFGFRGSFEAFVSNGAVHYHCDYARETSLRLISAFNIRDHLVKKTTPS